MSGIRDTYPTWASVPAHIQRAVNAYDDARRQDSPWEWAMSERNKTSIAPMIEAAIEAAKPPPGADSGLAAADDNRRDVPRDEEGRDAYQIIADGNRQAMLRRAGVKDRSREPLLGPPSDMLVSRILLEALPDVDPKRADQLAVKINDALPADDNHKALVELGAAKVGTLLTYDGVHDTGYRFVKVGDDVRPNWLRGARSQDLYEIAFQSRQEGK